MPVVPEELSEAIFRLQLSRYGSYSEMLRTPIEDYYYSGHLGPYEFFDSQRTELYTRDFAGATLADVGVEPCKDASQKMRI